jgi:hypothetical protein
MVGIVQSDRKEWYQLEQHHDFVKCPPTPPPIEVSHNASRVPMDR